MSEHRTWLRWFGLQLAASCVTGVGVAAVIVLYRWGVV